MPLTEAARSFLSLFGIQTRSVGFVALLVVGWIVPAFVGVVARGFALLVHFAGAGIGRIGVLVDLRWFFTRLRLHGGIACDGLALVTFVVGDFLVMRFSDARWNATMTAPMPPSREYTTR
jgi:uncharacterized membrane protein